MLVLVLVLPLVVLGLVVSSGRGRRLLVCLPLLLYVEG